MSILLASNDSSFGIVVFSQKIFFVLQKWVYFAKFSVYMDGFHKNIYIFIASGWRLVLVNSVLTCILNQFIKVLFVLFYPKLLCPLLSWTPLSYPILNSFVICHLELPCPILSLLCPIISLLCPILSFTSLSFSIVNSPLLSYSELICPILS